MSLAPAVLGVVLAVFLGGCAGLPTDCPRQRSEAIHDTEDTRIGREGAPLLAVHTEKSGVFTLANGLDAFVPRLALAEAADRTLDVQYYLSHDDLTGRLLAGHLLRAADRGVRVRLLLDDMGMGGKDAGLAAVAQHPAIVGVLRSLRRAKRWCGEVRDRRAAGALMAVEDRVRFGDLDVPKRITRSKTRISCRRRGTLGMDQS